MPAAPAKHLASILPWYQNRTDTVSERPVVLTFLALVTMLSQLRGGSKWSLRP
jgi:hypothetical protein